MRESLRALQQEQSQGNTGPSTVTLSPVPVGDLGTLHPALFPQRSERPAWAQRGGLVGRRKGVGRLVGRNYLECGTKDWTERRETQRAEGELVRRLDGSSSSLAGLQAPSSWIWGSTLTASPLVGGGLLHAAGLDEMPARPQPHPATWGSVLSQFPDLHFLPCVSSNNPPWRSLSLLWAA